MSESAINQAHPDDEADLFFGGGDDEEPTEETTEPQPEFDPVTQKLETPEATAEPEPEPEPAPDPTPPAESAGPTEPEPETPADPTPASSDGQGGSDDGKTRGALEREYLVFHKVPLTEKALKFLLKEIEDGRAPEPRVAFLQVHRTKTRNVNGAIAEAYNQHQDRLGVKVDLAAVSERSFQQRHVEPRQKVETNISIT